MKHRVGYNPLNRKPAHRKALHRNMVTSLFRHERIRTTKAKAQAIRRTAEKMITRAKVDSVHNRRTVGKDLKDKAILAKLFTEIAPRFKERPGGYTRVLKIGYRAGDAAEMVLLELVGEMAEPEAKKPSKKSSAGAEGKKPAKAKAEKPVAEEKASAAEETEEPEVSTDAVADEAAVAEEAHEEAPAEDAADDGVAEEEPADGKK